MAWKPDFSQSDPWVGMPEDYLGKATFVPTIENPIAPWGKDFERAGEVYLYQNDRYLGGGLLNTGIMRGDYTEQIRQENQALILAAAGAAPADTTGSTTGPGITNVIKEVVQVPGLDEISAQMQIIMVIIVILLLLAMG